MAQAQAVSGARSHPAQGLQPPVSRERSRTLLHAMKVVALLACVASMAPLAVSLVGLRSADPDEPCEHQGTFNVTVCESFMCTECTQAYCMETCQEWQAQYPACRCSHWPADKKSFSKGDFVSKGKYGDVGDYGTGEAWSDPDAAAAAGAR